MIVSGLRYAADRLRVLRALVNVGLVGLDERMRELELAQAIDDPQAQIEAVSLIVGSLLSVQAPSLVLRRAVDRRVAALAMVGDEVARARAVRRLAPIAACPAQHMALLDAARAIGRGDARAEALIALAEHAPDGPSGQPIADADARLDEPQAAVVAWWAELRDH